MADKIVYTDPIDDYFGYKLGMLEYCSVRFENEFLDKPDFQDNVAVNYMDRKKRGHALLNTSGLSLKRMETI